MSLKRIIISPWQLHVSHRGGSRIFIGGGGGGAKDYVPARTFNTSAEPNSHSAVVQGPLKGPGSFRVVLLSRAIWALFLSILVQNGRKNIVDQILGGRLLRPPLNPPLKNHYTSMSMTTAFISVASLGLHGPEYCKIGIGMELLCIVISSFGGVPYTWISCNILWKRIYALFCKSWIYPKLSSYFIPSLFVLILSDSYFSLDMHDSTTLDRCLSSSLLKMFIRSLQYLNPFYRSLSPSRASFSSPNRGFSGSLPLPFSSFFSGFGAIFFKLNA